jgi:prevent-host-death family protein
VVTVSIRELARNAAKVVEQVTRTGRPTLIAKRGKPVAVVLPVDQDKLEQHIIDTAPEYVARRGRSGRTRP